MNIYWSISKKLVVIWVLVGTLFLIAIAGSTFFITSKALEENVQFQVKDLGRSIILILISFHPNLEMVLLNRSLLLQKLYFSYY